MAKADRVQKRAYASCSSVSLSAAEVTRTLHGIYVKHRRKHTGNPDSRQMCCMWSTSNPPDVLEGTQPILDIEGAFGISISEAGALQLYDMMLDEAVMRIIVMKQRRRC